MRWLLEDIFASPVVENELLWETNFTEITETKQQAEEVYAQVKDHNRISDDVKKQLRTLEDKIGKLETSLREQQTDDSKLKHQTNSTFKDDPNREILSAKRRLKLEPTRSQTQNQNKSTDVKLVDKPSNMDECTDSNGADKKDELVQNDSVGEEALNNEGGDNAESTAALEDSTEAESKTPSRSQICGRNKSENVR